ncbi:MAG: hypothetical protein ACRD4F_13850 [Candidatus Angelobacter sp.]
MARGWESKSIESQIESSGQAKSENQPSPSGSPVEKQRRRQREELLLSRAYLLQRIANSGNERYTESLRNALAEIESKLGNLDGHQ